jgi:lipopolysaccharide assembly outer membrane protein LptD (OstA)
MNSPRLWSAILLVLVLARPCPAQKTPGWNIFGQTPQSSWESTDGSNFIGSNGIIVSNQAAVITGDSATANELNGEVSAEGDVTILDHGHIWRGTNFIYNFKTGDVRAGAFKTFQTPFALAGRNLSGHTNEAYTATNAIVTTDDYARPAYTIHAQRIVITPGERFQAYHATLYLGKTPIFYWPYYSRSLKQNQNNFEFEPGYRSIFGPYILGAYNWYGYSNFDGTIHLDEREKRGLAGGPDLFFHMGVAGDAAVRYYFADDHNPQADGIAAPHLNRQRQRAALAYEVTISSNLTETAVAHYQSDPLVIRDFYEGEYNQDVQPRTYSETTQRGDNYVLDAMVEPRVINFFETVERLPDIKLDELRQQVGPTPVYYESESSIGYYQRQFSDTNVLPNTLGMYPTAGPVTNTPNYSGARSDTYQQFTLPETFFGWLNVTPRIGGRLTYYGETTGLGIHTNAQLRAALNTGMDVSFRASRVYPEMQIPALEVNELRHIIQPEFDYGYSPAPTRSASQVPQYDYQQPSLRLLPLEYPQNNSIDSIGRQNTLRLILRNRLQTKRIDGVEDLLNWAIYTDWNITPKTNAVFSDLYNDVTIRPRSWLTLSSFTRYDLQDGLWRDAIEGLTIQPTSAWSVQLGYRYLMNNDPEFLTYPNQSLPGHNLISGSIYYRLNENWGFHFSEIVEMATAAAQQQLYTIYRDFRSGTGALTFRVTEGPGQPDDYTVAFTFSLKALPRFGSDADQPLSRLVNTSVTDPAFQ